MSTLAISHNHSVEKGGVSEQDVWRFLQAHERFQQLSPRELERAVGIAVAHQLDPWKREVHFIIDGVGKTATLSIYTGYETLLKRAERSGKLDGWRVHFDESGDELKVTLEIQRKDWSSIFRHELYLSEALPTDAGGATAEFWRQKPRFQLEKVGIAQAFRLCFPEVLGGLPYEFAKVSVPAIVTDQAAPPAPVQKFEAMPAQQNQARNRGESLSDLKAFIEVNSDSFTESLKRWILAKAGNDETGTSVKKMLGYARKVVSGKVQPGQSTWADSPSQSF